MSEDRHTASLALWNGPYPTRIHLTNFLGVEHV